MAKVVSKEMIISDLIGIDDAIIPILMASGMHCVGCPSAQGESLEEACFVHGIDVDEVVAGINQYLATKAQ
jgi:hybrid cluster-associated redox disulfide protein